MRELKLYILHSFFAHHYKVLKREEQHFPCNGKMNKVAQTFYRMAALTRFHCSLSSLVFPL